MVLRSRRLRRHGISEEGRKFGLIPSGNQKMICNHCSAQFSIAVMSAADIASAAANVVLDPKRT